MSRPDFLSPIYLRSAATLGVANGSSCTPDPQKLLNPNRTPMLIDQFRFSGPTVSDLSMAIGDVCQYILADIRLGSIPLTNGLVPIGAFAPTYLLYPGGASMAAGQIVADTQLVWHLPRPMYVPPDVQVSVKFARAPFAAIGANSASLPLEACSMVAGIAGRSMPHGSPVPDKMYVPWVGATSIYDAVTEWESRDSELGNPHRESMRITKFVGFNGKVSTRLGGSGETYTSLQMNCAPDFNLRMTLSSGKMLVRDPTPYCHLFPGERPYFNCDGVLQQNEFVRAMLSMTPVTGGLAGADPQVADLRFTTIGMQGYREIQTPQGAQP